MVTSTTAQSGVGEHVRGAHAAAVAILFSTLSSQTSSASCEQHACSVSREALSYGFADSVFDTPPLHRARARRTTDLPGPRVPPGRPPRARHLRCAMGPALASAESPCR